jgi:fatty-acyl-CoA synthase
MERLGFRVTHLYGLTETNGPAAICERQPHWDALIGQARSRQLARQGVGHALTERVAVLDPQTLQPVPPDGKTLGEIMVRSNTLMKGYLRNPTATAEAFAGGWLHTGDLAVLHPDSHVEIKDRAKDIIISGGENVASLEVEELLYRHPQIMEAAVVAMPHPRWGESPCAFVCLKPDAGLASAKAIIEWCRERLAHFKCPRRVVFGALPKTATGKIQKFRLRERAAQLPAE